MTGLLRKATLLAAVGVLTASAAMAAVPSASNSTAPALVPIVTRDNLIPSNKDNANFGLQSPTFTVVVRDLANNPLANASVVFDLGNTPDLMFCGDQDTGENVPLGALNNCGAK